jgi:hypothetical protein
MICDVDVTLIHPFPGMDQYTGFDVTGIMMSKGNLAGFQDPALVMSGPGDTRLLNADGYTRWWNPAEFSVPGQPIFRYKDGLLGNPNSTAHFNCTLNGYKFFADDLNSTDSILTLTPTNRAVFSAGQSRTRHYKIDFTGGVVFNYAVDANWEPLTGSVPYTVDDFPPSANRPEAWAVTVTEIENTLWNDGAGSGGDLKLRVEAWDHYNAGLNSILAESPGNFDPVSTSAPIGGGDSFSTYEIDIPNATPHPGSIDILIAVKSEVVGYWDLLPAEPVAGYFIYTANVAGLTPGITVISPNGGEKWEGKTHQDIEWTAPGIQFVDISYSKDDFVGDIHTIAANVANTGTYDWLVENDPSTTVKVKVRDSAGTIEDTSDDYFKITKAKCHFGDTGFSIDTGYDNVPGVWAGTGIIVTRQDSTQRIVGHSWPGEGYGGIIKVFNASDPPAGAVATYDTGDLIYCNNDQAMWMDGYSEPGIDRIFYVNFGGGGPTSSYQLKSIDWNGTAFSNPKTMPKPSGNGWWSICFKPNGDFITMDAISVSPSFWLFDKSGNYAPTKLFTMPQSTCPFGTVGNIREIAYDPTLDAIILEVNNAAVSNGGQLFALDQAGTLLFQDTDIFGTSTLIRFNMGLNIDLTSPDCHVVAYVGTDDGTGWFARFSGDMTEKQVKMNPSFYAFQGLSRGDIQTDGTLWAVPDTGMAKFYKINHPMDW